MRARTIETVNEQNIEPENCIDMFAFGIEIVEFRNNEILQQ